MTQSADRSYVQGLEKVPQFLITKAFFCFKPPMRKGKPMPRGNKGKEAPRRKWSTAPLY